MCEALKAELRLSFKYSTSNWTLGRANYARLFHGYQYLQLGMLVLQLPLIPGMLV